MHVIGSVGLKVGFTKEEFRANESDLQITAVVLKEGENMADLYFTLQTVSFEDFLGNKTDFPSPARGEINIK